MKKLVPVDAVLIPDSAQQVFEGQIFKVYQWQQELYDGSHATFEMLRRPDTTSAIGVVDRKILLLDDEQPNRPLKKSFPGGRVDATDPDILVATQREMLEETGYEFANWRLVHVSQRVGKIEWFIHIFVAWDGRKVKEPQLDAGERIQVSLESFNAVKELALKDVGWLGESAKVFQQVNSIEELLSLPGFEGKEIER